MTQVLPPAEAAQALEELIEATRELRRRRGLPDHGRRLFHLQLDTINLCNLQCKECSVHLIRDVVRPLPMSRETLARVADQVFPLCLDVNFAALAEPWMSPVLPEAMELARARGVPYLQMISNALLLTEKRARKLIEIQLDRISVSTDAATPETYKKIRGGDLERVVRNLRRLKELKEAAGSRKPQVKFNYVILRTNLHELEQFVDFAYELGAEVIDFRLPFLLDRQGIEDELPHRDPRFDEMILRARERMEALGIQIEQLPETNAERAARGYRSPVPEPEPGPRPDGTPHCDAPWGFLVIWPTGDVHPCCSPYMLGSRPMGNLNRFTLAQILTSRRYRSLRESLVAGRLWADCAQCKATDFLSVYRLPSAYYVDTGPRLPIAGLEDRRPVRSAGGTCDSPRSSPAAERGSGSP